MSSNETLYCPNCPARHHHTKHYRTGVALDITEYNYHGCGVDIATCPQCEKDFQVSYKVDEIKEVTW